MICSLKEDWTTFAVAVLPEDAGPIQQQEMRRAFYAGAWAMLCKTWELSDDSVSVADGVDSMKRLREECEEFKDQVTRGEA